MRYSSDLRKKVIEAVNSKEYTKLSISKMYKICRSTIDSWLSLVKTEGLYKVTPQTNIHSRKLDLEELKKQLELTPDIYQYELADKLKVSQNAVFYNMKKLGISRKKNKKTSENEVKN
jgi:transposase